MSDPLGWIADALDRLDQQGLRRDRREVVPLPNGRCLLDDRELWNFSANDYLGLADDSRLIAAVQQASIQSGIGARASALVSGRTDWHVQLEQRLAEFKHAEAALLFPTGFAANVGTIGALVGPGDAVFSDRLNHASLIDGCRLSRAKFHVYPHCDIDDLRKQLGRSAEFGRRLIVSDSLFSMDGDQAPLRELIRLSDDFDAMLLVDEAHATGVFGRNGGGLLEDVLPDLSEDSRRRVIAVGTLSKAVGVQGGFVTGSKLLIDWIWNTARTQVFSTALAVPLCAAAIAAIEIIEQEPDRREWLREASQQVRETLGDQGWNVPDASAGPIVPILLGDADLTMTIARQLVEKGVLAAAIRPPTVPRDTSRLRISLSYSHGDEGIAALLNAFERIR